MNFVGPMSDHRPTSAVQPAAPVEVSLEEYGKTPLSPGFNGVHPTLEWEAGLHE
jgi:hypothetical protein